MGRYEVKFLNPLNGSIWGAPVLPGPSLESQRGDAAAVPGHAEWSQVPTLFLLLDVSPPLPMLRSTLLCPGASTAVLHYLLLLLLSF